MSDLERGINATARASTARRIADALELSDEDRREFIDRARGVWPEDHVTDGTGGATRTLPRDIFSFTGRDQEIRQLSNAVARSAGAVCIQAVGGMAGVGKTALAVHVAHQLGPQFPDGQLFVPLHGHTPGQPPATPVSVLGSLLLVAGIEPDRIPTGLAARIAMWRDFTAGRKLLLVLDDAASSEQVQPLLPTAAGSLALITSRQHLLTIEDARTVSLDTLKPGEAALLLARLTDREDLDSGSPGVRQTVRLCGYLPRAIGLAARRLHHHPAWTAADMAADLAGARSRLERLRAEHLSVAAAFDTSYTDLTDASQRMFRRLGLHPGPGIDRFAAAALAGSRVAAAQQQLEDLYNHYLLTEPRPGRYRLHDLIREHARSLAEADDATDREAALSRLLGYYLRAARAADRYLARRVATEPATTDPLPELETPGLADVDAAQSWMNSERLNIDAVVACAVTRGRPGYAVAFSNAMHGFLRTQGYWDQGLALPRLAEREATQSGEVRAQAGALIDLGDLYHVTGDYAAATICLRRARQIAGRVKDTVAEAEARKSLSFVQYETGSRRAATAGLTRARELFHEAGDQVGEASVLGYLGVVQLADGNYSAALPNQERALDLHRQLKNRLGEANALNFLGVAQFSVGDYPAAAASQERALTMYRGLGNRYGEANALNWLGVIQQANGAYAAAAVSQDEALTRYRDLGYRMGEANALHRIGSLLQETTSHREGESELGQALLLFRELGIRQGEAEVLNTIGEAAFHDGRTEDALSRHQQALAIATDIASAPEKAHALEGIGRCYLRENRRAEAVTALRRAARIYRRIDPGRAGRVKATLRDISR